MACLPSTYVGHLLTLGQHLFEVFRVGGDKFHKAPVRSGLALGHIRKALPSHHNVSEQRLLSDLNSLKLHNQLINLTQYKIILGSTSLQIISEEIKDERPFEGS